MKNKMITMSKHLSSVQKAIHRQKKIINKAVNKKEQEIIPKGWFPRFLYDMGLAIDKLTKK